MQNESNNESDMEAMHNDLCDEDDFFLNVAKLHNAIKVMNELVFRTMSCAEMRGLQRTDAVALQVAREPTLRGSSRVQREHQEVFSTPNFSGVPDCAIASFLLVVRRWSAQALVSQLVVLFLQKLQAFQRQPVSGGITNRCGNLGAPAFQARLQRRRRIYLAAWVARHEH